MKLEYGIIASVSFLIAVTFGLIYIQPDEATSWEYLDHANQQAILAKAEGNKDKLEEYRALMQGKLQTVASDALGVQITSIYLDADYNFPFRDKSEIDLRGDQPQTIPICDMVPKIPVHLKKIRTTEMFSLFSAKYHNYPIELVIQDERYFNSTVHYSIIAKSREYFASAFFHVNSCTDQLSVPYNLSCRGDAGFMHTNYKNEVVASLQSDEFCEINIEPWRQELFDYLKTISDEMDEHRERFTSQDDHSIEEAMRFQYEMERLGHLTDIVRHAMTGDTDREKMQEMIREYKDRFGPVPDEFLKLIDVEKAP